jgi:hypothetical protein
MRIKTVMTFPDYITAHLNTPFEWGSFDCILFASRWIKHATGIDDLEQVLPWSSAREAMRMLDEKGGMEALLDARFERINPNLAADGDLAMCQGVATLFSGVHIVGTGKNGLVFESRLRAEGAWSVAKRIQPTRT